MALRTRLQLLSWRGSCSRGGREFISDVSGRTRSRGKKAIRSSTPARTALSVIRSIPDSSPAILATGLAVGTVTAILGAVLISFGLSVKARAEEKFLTSELDPSAYESYRRRVPMLDTLPPSPITAASAKAGNLERGEDRADDFLLYDLVLVDRYVTDTARYILDIDIRQLPLQVFAPSNACARAVADIEINIAADLA